MIPLTALLLCFMFTSQKPFIYVFIENRCSLELYYLMLTYIMVFKELLYQTLYLVTYYLQLYFVYLLKSGHTTVQVHLHYIVQKQVNKITFHAFRKFLSVNVDTVNRKYLW